MAKTNRKPSQEFLDSIAKNVRNRRIAQQLTQERLAERCGCKTTIINTVECAVMMNHSISTIEMIANGLGCDITALLERVQHESPGPSTKQVGEAYRDKSSTTEKEERL